KIRKLPPCGETRQAPADDRRPQRQMTMRPNPSPHIPEASTAQQGRGNRTEPAHPPRPANAGTAPPRKPSRAEPRSGDLRPCGATMRPSFLPPGDPDHGGTDTRDLIGPADEGWHAIKQS